MKTKIHLVPTFALALALIGTVMMAATPASAAPPRPQGPCDIYGAAGDPCVAAHSTTRALYASYKGPLYRLKRQLDGKTLDIGVVQPANLPVPDAGGYADAAAQDAFCANTNCWISIIYDQSPRHNDLTQAPRGAFSGPAMGGFNNLPLANMAPVTIMGHKVYGVFIMPGMGLRQNDAKGTAVDDQAEGEYWVINGQHYNSGCCFDYGNAEIDSRDDDNGTMETTYYGNSTGWYHGTAPGPWVMTDQENNLVGCVNPEGLSKLCTGLPTISWRFVTAMAKGEPHHWTSLGGDARQGALAVMFDGGRVNTTYDPMRKQGAILLGNGGDNSNSSQGTFYEGAMTAAGTFPSNATDELVQANVVAAKYDVQRLSLAPSSATATPPGVQIFSPRSSQDTTVTFTNTTGAPVTGLKLSISLPNKQWAAFVQGTAQSSKTFVDPIAPGSSVSATFKVTSGAAAFNGDLVAEASWTSRTRGASQSEKMAERVRNVSPVKINEFRVSSADNATNAFIELFNAGAHNTDISNWSLAEHSTQQALFSTVKIPPGTTLAARGFYLIGLSNSGLALPVGAGATTVYVRNTTGLSVGDTITIGTGADAETRKIASLGTAVSNNTTLWQPLPDGPVIKVPVGSKNVPVTSVAGFAVGEKIALGYGAAYPAVAKAVEKYEVATVTAVGKPGTQAFLGADALMGASNIKVTNVANISVGDKIRLDIDSVGHGIETVTVTRVGTAAIRTALLADAPSGATNIKIRGANGPGGQGSAPLAVGDKLVVGTPGNHETVTITVMGTSGATGAGIDFTPALSHEHANGEGVVDPGTGLDLAASLRFNHSANLPFAVRGTGISFATASAFVHSSDEPVQPLGTGITLDRPLTKFHAIDAVLRDASTTTAGYQGPEAPNQWFGGPALSTGAGSMVLRDAAGLVVDSLNYGLLVDPWASEGYQATSGTGQGGCRVASPGPAIGNGARPAATPPALNRSAGRFPDGFDTASNCTDFRAQPATSVAAASAAGANNIKVASVADFTAGQTIMVDTGANLESAVIGTVGTAGATTVGADTGVGDVIIPVASIAGFGAGQTISIDDGAKREMAIVVSAAGGAGGARITITAPLALAHAAGAQVSGSGLILTAALARAHASGAQVITNIPTPGAPNRY
jgi:hypothetical protein